jgi:acetyl-CoA acyltransferase
MIPAGREPVIVEAVRTPVGKRDGFFKDTRADEIGVVAIQGLLERTRIAPAEIEDVVFGCVTGRGEQGFNIARIIALEAGLPIETAGVTINRLCGSSQQAIHFAAQEILAGVCDCAIAGGVESMTREPMGSDLDKPLNPKLSAKYEIVPQGRVRRAHRRSMEDLSRGTRRILPSEPSQGRARPGLWVFCQPDYPHHDQRQSGHAR